MAHFLNALHKYTLTTLRKGLRKNILVVSRFIFGAIDFDAWKSLE